MRSMHIHKYLKYGEGLLSVLSIICLLCMSMVVSGAKRAYAGCGCCVCCERCVKPPTVQTEHSTTRQEINDFISFGESKPDDEEDPGGFKDHRQGFLIPEFWEEMIRPTLKIMTAQFTSVAYQHTAIIGSFFDATIQQETQLALQKRQTEAVKDYAPSRAMCSMGTVTRSLAASQAKSRTNRMALNARGMQRQLGTANSIAAEGPKSDKQYRANQFIETFCATLDNNADPDLPDTGLGLMCDDGSASAHKQNRDVDFIRTLAEPLTIRMDLTNDQLETSDRGADEEDVMALASNLYAHNVFENISPGTLKSDSNQKTYIELRSLAAKRNVAMNSFNAIAGMKASGSGASTQYLEAIAEQLGIDDNRMQAYLGEDPSYHAQMAFLTKKMFQDPGFVTKLVDRPANVKRQQAAMKSFELMQKRDIYQSMKRSEMLLAVLLELKLMQNQDEVEDKIRGMTRTTGGG